MVYESEKRIAGVMAFLLVPVSAAFLVFVIYIAMNLNQIPIKRTEDYNWYSNYVRAHESLRLGWEGGGSYVCSYTTLRWKDGNTFEIAGENEYGVALKLGANSKWDSRQYGKWSVGPFHPPVVNNSKKLIENCLNFSFGRKPDIREFIASSADWVRISVGSRSKTIVAISNELHTVAIFRSGIP